MITKEIRGWCEPLHAQDIHLTHGITWLGLKFFQVDQQLCFIQLQLVPPKRKGGARITLTEGMWFSYSEQSM